MNNDFKDQVQYSAAQTVPAELPADPEVEELTEKAFSKGLAAAIMAWFPIASIIAIIFGSKAQKLVVEARELAASRGEHAPGKLIPSKALGTVGKIGGIVMTALWGMYACIYSFALLRIIFH